MFSAIIGFFENILNLKLKKQQRKSKQELKKEVDKNSKEDIITAKEKAKKSKKVVESKEKEKSLKIKVLLLKVFKWVVSIIEQFITWILSVIGVYGILIILAVIVLMIIIYGLLHIDMSILSDYVFKRNNDDCIQTSTVIESSWDDVNLGQLQGGWTQYQKNLYKTFSLVDEFLKGDGTNTPKMKELPHDIAFKVYRGIPAVESSFYIFGPSDTSHDVLKDLTDNYEQRGYPANKDEYWGAHQIDKDSSVDYDEYYKFWDGKNFINTWKSKYPKPDGSSKDHYWMPYSVAMSLMHSQMMGSYGNLNTTSSGYDSFKTFVDESMDHFGIVANREECFQYIRALLSVSCYLQGQGMAKLNYSTAIGVNAGGGAGRINYMCAVFAASSKDDSKRSFNNYSIILNDETKYEYGEGSGSLREWLIGSNGYGSYISDIGSLTLGGRSPRIQVDGKELDVPLMKYIYDIYKDDPYMTDTWTHIKGVKGQYLSSYHYGFACLFQGNHIVAELGVSVPTASYGKSEDCICEDGEYKGTQNIGSRDFSSVKEGEIQGLYSEEVKEKMRKDNTYKKLYGSFGSLREPDGKLGNSGTLTREEWRKESKWQIPYLYQWFDSDIEKPLKNVTYGGNSYDSACPTFQMAYIYSALTGRAVNIAEIQAAITAYSGANSVSFSNFANMAKESGVYVRAMMYKNNVYEDKTSAVSKDEAPVLFPDESLTLKGAIDYVLENNGIVGVTVGSASPYTTDKHYLCIIEKIGENSYKTYSESSPDLDANPQTLENIIGPNGSWLYTGHNTDLLFAYNPNLGSISNSNENYLFIGDSFTAGLDTNIGLTSLGFTVKAEVGKSPSYWDDDTKISELPSEVGGVVVLLGVNNPSEIESMKSLLSKLKTKYNKPIYVQKVFPLGSNYTINDLTTTMSSINTFNDEIKSFCDNTDGLNFIDTTGGLVGEDGYLLNPDTEGLHINKKEDFEKWWSNLSSALSINDKTVNSDYDICKSSKNASTVGAADLSVDVVDLTNDCKASWQNHSQGKMTGPEVIVIHYWGNEDKKGGKVGRRLLKNSLLSAYKAGSNPYFAHFYVDYEGMYQIAPVDEYVQHAGGGSNITNSDGVKGLSFGAGSWNGIGIEVSNVQTAYDVFKFEKSVIEKTISLTKALMDEYNIDVDHVVRHYDCMLKICPAPFVDTEYGTVNTSGPKSGSWDKGESKYWKAFKAALVSDTIDWDSFGDTIVEESVVETLP